jgi:hypothetical protein
VLPIENLPLARVLFAFAIDPYKSAIEQAAVEYKRVSGLRAIQKRRASTSALSHKRTFGPFIAMSALPPKDGVISRRPVDS